MTSRHSKSNSKIKNRSSKKRSHNENNRTSTNTPKDTANSFASPIPTAVSEMVNDLSQLLPPPRPNRPFLTSLLCSIFEPGVNSSLLAAIHFVFISLLLVHAWLVYLTEGRDLHVWALMGINLMLYPSLLIFIHLAYKN